MMKSPDRDAPDPDERPRRRPRFLIVAVVLFLLAVVGCIWGCVNFLSDGSQAALDAHIAELEARGEPTEWSGLFDTSRAPEENGAPLVREAWTWLDENEPELGWEFPEIESLADWEAASSVRKDSAKALARRLGDPLASLSAAARRPYIAFHTVDYPYPAPPLEHTYDFPRTLQVLLTTLLAVDDPSATGSVLRAETLAVWYQLGVKWDEPVISVDTWASVGTQLQALDLLRQAVELGWIAPGDAAAVFEPLLGRRGLPSYFRFLRTSRTEILDLYLPAFAADIGEDADGFVDRSFRRSVIRLSESLQRLIDMPSRAAPDLVRGALDESEPDSLIPAAFDLVGIAVRPTLATALHLCLTVDAHTALARITFAAERHRDRTGRWPATLEDLAEQFPDGLPRDPFTGEPFLFERLPDGIRISSAGAEPRLTNAFPMPPGSPQEAVPAWELHDR